MKIYYKIYKITVRFTQFRWQSAELIHPVGSELCEPYRFQEEREELSRNRVVKCVPTKDKPECMRFTDNSPNFRASPGGYDPGTISPAACQELCNNAQFDFAGLCYGKFCLCSNTISDETLPTEDCSAECPGGGGSCGSDDPGTLSVLAVEKMGSVYNVSVQVGAEELFVDDPVEISVLVDADTTFKLSVFFGDDTSTSSQESPFSFQKYYRIPGKYTIRALAVDVSELNEPMFQDIYITVEDKKVDFEVECPIVIEPGSTANCSAIYIRGTQLFMEYESDSKVSDEAQMQYNIPDMPMYSIGLSIPPLIKDNTNYIALEADEVHLPDKIKIRSIIMAFEYYGRERGNLDALVLRPLCTSGEYCPEKNACDSACAPYGMAECGAEKVLCSYVGKCFETDASLDCPKEPATDLQYEIKHVFPINVEPGNQYYEIPAAERALVLPGDIIGFKISGGAALWNRNATLTEINKKNVDTHNSESLGVRHYFRAFVVEPVNITIQNTLETVGNYSLKVTTKNFWTEDPHVKQLYIPVQIPVINISLSLNPVTILVGMSAPIIFRAENGSDITLVWDYGNGTLKEETYEGLVPSEGYSHPVTCDSTGDFTVSVNASNLLSFQVASIKLQCSAAVTKNWQLTTDSPQKIPPGTITIHLIHTKESTSAPAVDVVFDFGDGNTEDPFKFGSKAVEVSGKWQATVTHDYASEGNYGVVVNISNAADTETFQTQVAVAGDMGQLSVSTHYVEAGSPNEKKELNGPNKDTAPTGSMIFFECSITGAVTIYMMKCIKPEGVDIEYNSSNKVISHTFPQAGTFTFRFVAWEERSGFSNEVDVVIHIVSVGGVEGLHFTANSTMLQVEENVVFKIELAHVTDILNCIIFDPGDQTMKLGFGLKLTCDLSYREGAYQFIAPSFEIGVRAAAEMLGLGRKRRDVTEALRNNTHTRGPRKRREAAQGRWTDTRFIEIDHKYMAGGDYQPSVVIINPFIRQRKALYILVTDGDYLQPLVYIDDNSTDIDYPVVRERGKEFRFETTAIFRNNESYSATHKWSVFRIDESGKELYEINVTGLKTHNCSAIRIPERFLDLGLYMFKYNLTVLQEIPDTVEKQEPVKQVDNRYRFDSYDDEEEEEEEEEVHDYVVLGYRATISFVRINSSLIIPMLIDGGATYVTRGFGQKIWLEPTKYSEDPDDPENKAFVVTWYCKKVEENLPAIGECEYEPGTPSSPILDRTDLKEENNKGGCFGSGPGKVLIGDGDFLLTTDMFWGPEAKYEMIGCIKKDTRVAEGHITIDVIKERPPSIRIKCEKKIACFLQRKGQYINPNSWVSVVAECLEDCGAEKELQFSWKLHGSSTDNWPETEIENWGKHVVIDYDRMGINQSLYNEGPQYTKYMVSVVGRLQDESIPPGMASLVLLINKPPTGGICNINATSGLAMIDLFRVEFVKWQDPENQTIEDYSIYVKLGEERIRLQYGIKTEVDLVLPFGDLEVWCSVEDYMGGVTTQSVANFTHVQKFSSTHEVLITSLQRIQNMQPETTLPTKEEIEIFDQSRIFDRSLAEGRMFLVSQIIVARNSIMMAHNKQNDEGVETGVVSEVAIDNKWDEYLGLDGIDSSYFTPQAREEILEELQERLDKQMDRNAKEKSRELSKILKLPMDALPDTEIFGAALKSVAQNGPIDKTGKEMVMTGMKDMFNIINKTNVPHPEDKQVAINEFGGIADTMAESMSQGIIGGKFLPGEVKKAEKQLDYNVSEPNYFINFVEGNRQEVKERMKTRAVNAAKDDQRGLVRDMAESIKEMISTIKTSAMEEIMVGEDPFIAKSEKGFELTLLKKTAAELSGSEVKQGDASFILPNMCAMLGEADCGVNTSFGIQAVKWTTPLESYGSGSTNLSSESNVIQIEITNRGGNSTISVTNTTEPFIICIPQSGGGGKQKLEYVVPKLKRDDDILVYHSLTVKSPSVGVSIQLKPDNPEAPFIVLYKYGSKSALNDYDGMLSLKNMSESNGTFTAFIDSKIITEIGKDLYVGVGHLKETVDTSVIFAEPYSLKVVNMTNVFSSNYSIKISTAGCYYFDEETEAWSSKGCKVSSSIDSVTCCECNHLTSFGSGFFVMPNTIDFDYVFANAGFSTNYTIYFTIIVTFSLFIIFLIYSRWKDRKDVEKLGATPLPDNEPRDKYVYEILIFTGHQRNAGTKSNVFFIVSGEDDETEVRHLADDKRPILQSGAIDVFVMAVPRCLGQLNYLRLWHDNSGKGKWCSWYVKYVVFRDVQSGHKFEFIVNRWFAVEEDDGLIDRLIPIAGKEQATEFSHLFSTASQRNLADRHLWFSVFLRPPRSRFTRVQRVSCCVAVLYLSMLVNAMYYQRTTPQTGGFKLGPLSLTPEEIAVGIISNFIIFPPTFLMIFFFRKSRPRKLRPSRIEEALKQQRIEWKKKNPEPLQIIPPEKLKGDEEALLRRRKKKFTLPWWCVIFGWLFVFASIGVSIFFLWAYGITFGDEKTMNWLISLIISFFSSVLITQPIKIVLMAILVSCICRSVDYDEDDADEDEEDPRLAKDEAYLHEGKRPKRASYRPMDMEALEEARKEREKEVKMYAVLREIGAYFLFLWVVTILSFGNRDPNSFFLREALINGFIKPGDLYVEFNNVNTEKRLWNWTYNALIPELFAFPWYNNRTPLGLRLYLDDRNNMKIGYAVLRQVRIKPRSCEVHWLIESVAPECAGYGSVFLEDGGVYTTGWKEVLSPQTPVPPEYKYLSASQLRGFPFWGQLDWYGGGGYVVPLLATKNSEIKELGRRLERLEKEGWINRHTRAVFIEFGIYNAQVNLFCALTIVAEFLPGGGIIPYFHIDPVRLLSYHTGFGLLQVIVEILFVVFTIFFTVREVMNIGKQGFSYFKEYWNIIEILSILISYSGIGLYIYKQVITSEILHIFTTTEGTGYVKLQEAVLVDSIMCYQIGFIMSVSTLKFLKLLRFNRRIGVLSSTLRKCAEELQGYSVCLMIVFIAFVILFWHLLGRYVREFSTFVYAFESSISMMLKKFNYDDMQAASPIFTPIAFFTFSLATAVILINILLSIIIQSFEDVTHDVSQQGNEYEILDFFINRLKMTFGCGKAKVRPLPAIYRDKKKPVDTIASFPGKVDKLVDFINTVYFEDQVDFNSKEFLRKMNAAQDHSTSNDLIHRSRKKTIPNKAMKQSQIPKGIKKRFDDF